MTKKTFIEEPYFDDFDEKKGFQRILFKPRSAVQTRELNQLQTILSDQISKFGNHIFQHGSIVSDVRLSYNDMVDYVALYDTTPTTSPENVDINKLKDVVIIGKTSGVKAKVINQIGKTSTDPNTIYVMYLEHGVDQNGEPIKRFLEGETIRVVDNNNNILYNVRVLCSGCDDVANYADIPPLGYGSIFNMTSGIFYVYGYFVWSAEQSLVLNKYNLTPTSCYIGLDVLQSVKTVFDDESLYDNALGYPNFKAPGADRYKIELILTKRSLKTELNDDFVVLAKIQNSVLQDLNDKPKYSEIEKVLARRTYDESGDYTVTKFDISFKDYLKHEPNSSDGVYYPNGSESPEELQKYKDTFCAFFSPGKAYVKGYEIEKISSSYITIDKARDTSEVDVGALRVTHGSYIYITLAKNDAGTEIISNILPYSDIVDNKHTPLDFEVVRIYNGGITGGSTNGTQIGSLRVKGQEVYKTTATDVIYKLYVYDVKMDSGHSFSESTVLYKPGQTPFLANIKTDDDIYGSGDSTPKVYSPKKPTLLYKLPEPYIDSATNIILSTKKKFTGASDSTGLFTATVNGSETIQGLNTSSWLCGYQDTPGGVYIPFELTTSNVSFPDSQTVEVTGLPQSKNVVLVCDVMMENVTPREKVFDINVSEHIIQVGNDFEWIALPITDGVEVVKIEEIDMTTGNVVSDITGDFEFDKNIQDTYYGLSQVRRLESAGTLSAQIKVRVTVKYFKHVGPDSSYFSVESYRQLLDDPAIDFDWEDIPSYTDSSDETYLLASCFDFRPDQVNIDAENMFDSVPYIPSNNSNIMFDHTYYLSRIDILCLSQNGDFVGVRGIPSTDPAKPKVPEGMMKLYDVYLTPYTFDIQKDVHVKYIDNRRFTMRDIGNIERRVDNLEYYVLLNQLEKSVADLSIKDANGLEAFKNGFLTDNFVTYNASDIDHAEYNVTIDDIKGELIPSFIEDVVYLQVDHANSQNVKFNGEMVTEEYTDAITIQHNQASKHISVNPYFIFNWVGHVELSPSMDNFKDVVKQPTSIVKIPPTTNTPTVKPNTPKKTIKVKVVFPLCGYKRGLGLQNFFTTIKNTQASCVNSASPASLSDNDSDYGFLWIDKTKADALSLTDGSKYYWNDTRITGLVDSGDVFYTDPKIPPVPKSNVGLNNNTNTNTQKVNLTNGVNSQQSVNPNSSSTKNSANTLNTINLGTKVTDVDLLPFIRQMEVQFVVSGMRPNTVVYTFFDGEPVSDYCKPLNGSYGDELKTDDSGSLVGTFLIPNNDSLRFHVGDRVFLVSDSKTNSDDPDMVTTSASTIFWAGGLKVATQDQLLKLPPQPPVLPPPSILPPGLDVCPGCPKCAVKDPGRQAQCTTAGQQHVVHTNNNNALLGNRPDLVVQLTGDVCKDACIVEMQRVNLKNAGLPREPLAEQFWITNPNGAFVTKIGVFFQAKSESMPVWLELREMVNGYPGKKVFKNGRVVKPASQVNVSSDATVETVFEFPAPIFLEGDKDYCFVVGSNDMAYRLFASKLGETDIRTNTMITKVDYLGSMFRSQNDTTWTASQFEDLTFNIYTAQFDRSKDMVLKFYDVGLKKSKLLTNPFETESTKTKVRIHHRDHGFVVGDKVKIDLFDGVLFDVYIKSGQIIKGQTLTGTVSGAKCKVGDVVYNGIKNINGQDVKWYSIRCSEFTAPFQADEEFVSDSVYETIDDVRLLDVFDIKTDTVLFSQSTNFDSVRSTYPPSQNTVFGPQIPVPALPVGFQPSCIGTWTIDMVNMEFNGIPIDAFFDQNITVQAVDSRNSYVVELSDPATKTGFVGGYGVSILSHIQVDKFKLETTYFDHDSSFEFKIKGISHGGVGSVFSDYDTLDEFYFEPNTIVELNRPMKVANIYNAGRSTLSNGKSLDITITAKNSSSDPSVSPVFVLPATSFITITNRIEYNTCQNYSIEPNATTDGAALVCDPSDPSFNARWKGEEVFDGIYDASRYITKKVTLSEPATSLRVFMDVYQNIDNEIEVYYKTLETEKDTRLEDEKWVYAPFDKEVTSSKDDEFREVSITIGDEGLGQTPLPDFKEFRFKIVLKSKNSAKPPRIKNFRVVAVS